MFLSNNSIGLNWDMAIDNLHEIEVSNSGNLFPLNAMQLKLFPAIKDRCHKDGMAYILTGLFAKFVTLIIQQKRRLF